MIFAQLVGEKFLAVILNVTFTFTYKTTERKKKKKSGFDFRFNMKRSSIKKKPGTVKPSAFIQQVMKGVSGVGAFT